MYALNSASLSSSTVRPLCPGRDLVGGGWCTAMCIRASIQVTSQSSLARERPFTRLAHTARIFETIYFGSRAEADKVLETVHTLHSRVTGRLDRDAGTWPTGTAYDAFDPDLMLWTMAVLAD